MEYKRKPIAIEGWDMYECDTNGVIYGKNGRPLKPSTNPNGYRIVNLYNENTRKGFGVHTLIAKTFIPNPNSETKTQVNHKNGNKEDNSVENLEWVTGRENIKHSIKVLGYDKIGIKNPNAKEIWGYHKKTGELLYHFDCVINAAKFFANDNYKKARRIQGIISQIALNKGPHKSYRGCLWTYSKREEEKEE